MCAICYKSPCHPACPNADPPKPVSKCSWCEEDITEGKILHIQFAKDIVLCDKCKHEMSLSDLNELFDGEIFEALGFEKKEADIETEGDYDE